MIITMSPRDQSKINRMPGDHTYILGPWIVSVDIQMST
jgi:hypothetical protein